MTVTFFSFIMSILVSNLIMVLLYLCCRSIRIVGVVGPNILLFACGLCALRICLPIELQWTKEINVPAVYNPVYDAARTELPFWGITVMQLAVFIWISVSVILLIRFVLQYRRYHRRMAKLPLLDFIPVMAAAKRVIPEDKLRRIKIVSVMPDDVPRTVGILRPVIAMPLHTFKRRELELILQHEYTHLKNGDNLSKLLLALLRCLFWWCPAIHLFQYGFSAALEMRCDYLVTKSMKHSDMLYYLKTLAKSAFHDAKPVAGAVDSRLSDGKTLLQRVEVLLRYRTRKRSFIALVFCAIFSLAVFIGSYSFVLQSYYEEPFKDEIQIVQPSEDFKIQYHQDGTYSVTMNGRTDLVTEQELFELYPSFF